MNTLASAFRRASIRVRRVAQSPVTTAPMVTPDDATTTDGTTAPATSWVPMGDYAAPVANALPATTFRDAWSGTRDTDRPY